MSATQVGGMAQRLAERHEAEIDSVMWGEHAARWWMRAIADELALVENSNGPCRECNHASNWLRYEADPS